MKAIINWLGGWGVLHIVLCLFAVISVAGFGEFYAASQSEGGTGQYVEYADDAPPLLVSLPVFGTIASMVSLLWLFLWLPNSISKWGKRKWQGTTTARLLGFLPTAVALTALYWLIQAKVKVFEVGDLGWLGALIAVLLLFMLTPWYKKLKQREKASRLKRTKQLLEANEKKADGLREKIAEIEKKEVLSETS